LSPEGLRVDGRRPRELRQLRCKMSPVLTGDGSAFFEMGNTKVLAVVYGPHEPAQRGQMQNECASVSCEFNIAAFAQGERRQRRKGDRRTAEFSLMLKQTLEAAILTHLYPRTQIHVFVQVVQSDGGVRAASLNAAVLALADAGIATRDILASCCVGYLEGTPLLDMNYSEEGGGGPDLCVSMHPTLDKLAFLQMDNKVPLESFEQVLDLATDGCKAISDYMRQAILDNLQALVSTRGTFRV